MILKYEPILFVSLKGVMQKSIIHTTFYRKSTARKVYKDTQETSKQLVQREYFKQADKNWIHMTIEQRNEWVKFARRRKNQSGYSVQMSINLKRLVKGLNMIIVPPF